MLNSISGRNDFYSRYGGAESIYGRNTSVQSAGLSAQSLAAINQLSGIGSISASNLRLNNLNSLNSLSNDFLSKRSASSTVSLSPSAKIQSSLSTLNTELKRLAAPLRSNLLQATSSDPTVAQAKTLTGGAPAAAKNVNVEQLAQGQLSQTANFNAATELLGQGRLTIQLGAVANGSQQAEGRAISVDLAAIDTLSDVARKIQTAQPALKASVVSDEAGTRLQIENSATGAAQAFTIQAQSSDDEAASGNLAKLAIDASAAQNNANRVAQDARVQIDGRDLRSNTNVLNDPTSNLSLDIRQVGSTSVTLSRDVRSLNQNFAQLIEQFNQARSQLTGQTKSASSTDVGSGLARRELSRLDEVLSNLAVGQGQQRVSLNDLGITTASDGRLIVNETRLSQQALAQPEAANNLLNLAIDKLSQSTASSLQELSILNSPFQQIQRSANPNTSISFAAAGNALSLLQSSSQGLSLRGLYGVSQYLQVAQFR
ncbi:flagellar filament capping protein FliD [Chitinibacter sp. SCUT-21]|uniref:flagellar filament capping protein FliD n=1 Tax=Chitinibacter sp. SCUT-21 TaxID=2970891 RepID=UPI0035A6163D